MLSSGTLFEEYIKSFFAEFVELRWFCVDSPLKQFLQNSYMTRDQPMCLSDRM